MFLQSHHILFPLTFDTAAKRVGNTCKIIKVEPAPESSLYVESQQGWELCADTVTWIQTLSLMFRSLVRDALSANKIITLLELINILLENSPSHTEDGALKCLLPQHEKGKTP